MKSAPAPDPAFQRRRRVHDAVRELMAEQGFRVSMDAVAARAGCSKQTLYSHFGSKQELMHSVMHDHLDIATARLEGPDSDPRTVLLAFAMEHLQRLSDPHVITTCQLLSAEAAQYPDEARALYREGVDTLQQRLATWLDAAKRRGQLEHDDPHGAAELLLGMIVGLDLERKRFAVPHRDNDAKRLRWAEFAVDSFMKAFASDLHQAPSASRIAHSLPVSKS
ncbi:MAG: TetR/AcrR family transcriptional regulator [Pseudoxanthomonas sp.]